MWVISTTSVLFQTKFGKNYDKDEDDLKHLKTYYEALKTIEDHNKLYKEGKVSYEMGINQFTDLVSKPYCRFDWRRIFKPFVTCCHLYVFQSQEEFKKNCCGLVLPDKLKTGSS